MSDFSRTRRALVGVIWITPTAWAVGCSSQTREPLPAVPAVQHLTVMPVTGAPGQPIPAKSSDVRVMSFNLRCPTVIDGFNYWSFRKELMIATLRKFNPDVLGTQECVLEQANYLRENLADYEFVGAGRNDGKASGEMCGVLFKSAKFDRMESGHFWLSETPSVPGSKSWGSMFTRMVTWVKLRPKDGSPTFCVFNTHFDVWGKRARLESARLLRSEMSRIAGNEPSIVTGDFNDDPQSETYRTMLAGNNATDARLIDTFRVAHPKPTAEDGTIHSFGGRRGGQRIDWIFTTSSFQTIASGIDHTSVNGKFPSDHFPMVSVVRPTAATAQSARIE